MCMLCAAFAAISGESPRESPDVASVRFQFGDSRWLWPKELGTVTNAVLEFRTAFASTKRTPVSFAVAADTVYAVSLNGGEWKTGRFPNVPPSGFFDVLDMGECKSGENWISLKLYVQGCDSFQYIPGRQGIVFRLYGDGVDVESGAGVEWRVSRRDRIDGVPVVTRQLGYSFVYDASLPEDPWRKIEPEDVGPAASGLELFRRPVPPPAVLPAAPWRIVAQGSLDGSPVPEMIAAGMDATVMTSVEAEEFFGSDGRTVAPRWFKDGFYVLVDLGREEAGLLSMDIETDAGTVVDIGYAEHSENGRISVKLRGYLFAGRYRAKEGANSYCRWARRIAGRYIQIHVRGARSRFRLDRLTLKPVEFPVREAPLPAFAKGTVADIWRTCTRTLRLCMHEHYEDTPWREQAMYANDSRNQMLSGYYAFGEDNRMPEHCLRLLSRGIGDDGWMSLCVPTRIGRPIPSFTFSWVLSVDDHLKHRNDRGFVGEMMPSVSAVLERRLCELKDGLLPCPKAPRRYWQFYDWSKDLGNETLGMWEGDRFDAPLNLFCLLAFEAGARCADAVGDGERARRWRDAAEQMRKAVRKAFWNAQKCRMETAVGKNLAPAELVQSLALLADAVPRESRRAVAVKLSSPSDWTETSLSQSIYKYEALLSEGGDVADAALRSMTMVWKRMLDDGATSFWEVKEGWTAFGGLASLCHGWSAIPVYIYSKADRQGIDLSF